MNTQEPTGGKTATGEKAANREPSSREQSNREPSNREQSNRETSSREPSSRDDHENLTSTIGTYDKKPLRNLLVTVAAILLVSFLMILVNQTAQLVSLATQVHPVFGQVVLWFFILLAVATLIWLIVLLAAFEKPLTAPDESDQEAYARYLVRLKKRLMGNRYLKSRGFAWPTDNASISADKDSAKITDKEAITQALSILDEEARMIIRRQASTVFVTTAVSQNGSLDSLFVLVTILKLVWRISILYHQRPAIRDLIKLYSNIFGTVLLTRQIDDLDLIAEQLEPILTTLFGGSVGTMVPGIGYVVSFVADSIFEGSLNTLLTLRVGFIAQGYCRSMTRVEPRKIGKMATAQACQLLGSIIGDNSKRITQAILRAVRHSTTSAIKEGKGRFTETIDRLFRKREKGSEPQSN